MNNSNGYRVTFHVSDDSKIHREHNIRDPKIVKFEKHIDLNRYSETTLDLGTMEQAYDTIFGDAIWEYNQGRRKDRQIKNYLELIRNDARRGKHLNQKAKGGRKLAYEAYITIGNRDNQPDHEEAKKILKLFVEKWIPSHYKQIKPILISYHDDEFSYDDETGEKIYSPIHCHFDFIYLANSLTPEEQKKEKEYRLKLKEQRQQECKQQGIKFDTKAWQQIDWQEDLVRRTGRSLISGPAVQASLSGALLQMGFKTAKGKGTAQIQFEEQIRHDLQDFAESMGLKIDRTPGVKHRHVEKEVYQQKRDNERKEKKLNELEYKLSKEQEYIDKEQKKIDKKSSEQVDKFIKLEKAETELIEKEIKFKEKEDELTNKEKSLAFEKNDVDYKIKQYEQNCDFIKSCEDLEKEVKEQHLSIDEAEKTFRRNKDTYSFAERFSTFVGSVKKCFTAVVTELNRYKKAFQNFWRMEPWHFRKLADEMEREHCGTYEVFYQKVQNKMLAKDLELKRQNHQRYIENKKKISRDYDGMSR